MDCVTALESGLVLREVRGLEIVFSSSASLVAGLYDVAF